MAPVCEPGDSVFVCIRPEDVSVSPGADAGGRRNNFKAGAASIALKAGAPQAAISRSRLIRLLRAYQDFRARC